MKINGLKDHPRWYDVACCCSKIEGDVEHQHPICECRHCEFQQCEDSMPREDFTVKELDVDEDEDQDFIRKVVRKSDVTFINQGENSFENDIFNLVNDFFQLSNRDFFKYNVECIGDIQFSIYKNGGYYNWHTDAYRYSQKKCNYDD